MLQAREQYIPIRTGESFMIAGQSALLNNILGHIGYELKDGFVVFTEDITKCGVMAVDMELVVMDADKYDDYEPLPITADIASDVVTECFKILALQFPPDKIVSSQNVQNPDKR